MTRGNAALLCASPPVCSLTTIGVEEHGVACALGGATRSRQCFKVSKPLRCSVSTRSREVSFGGNASLRARARGKLSEHPLLPEADVAKSIEPAAGYVAGDGEGSISDMIERRLVSGERVLQINKADYTVSSVLDKIRRGKLDLRPSYQRDYVWDKRTASKLIESVLLNIPLPTMFFHERSHGHLEVVDGKQRLTSIWCFMEDQTFPDGSEFALTGLEVLDKLNGNKYSDLDESLREVMKDFALNVHTISRHSDAEVVFEVFERLNMGSTQLNEQELRNCVFQGRYNDLLEELARLPDMLAVFRHDVPHKRMRDREYILRFFALRRSGIENFYLPVKNWLNNEMRRHQFLKEEDFMVMKFDFQRCLSLSMKVFGEQVFRLPRGLKYESDPNVCLWDTIMYGFLRYRDDARVLNRKKVLLLALNDLLVYDAEFKSNLHSTPKALKIRTKKWLLVLKELLGPI